MTVDSCKSVRPWSHQVAAGGVSANVFEMSNVRPMGKDAETAKEARRVRRARFERPAARGSRRSSEALVPPRLLGLLPLAAVACGW